MLYIHMYIYIHIIYIHIVYYIYIVYGFCQYLCPLLYVSSICVFIGYICIQHADEHTS